MRLHPFQGFRRKINERLYFMRLFLMKTYYFFVLVVLIWLSLSAYAHADTDSATGMNSSGPTTGRGRHKGAGTQGKPGSSSKSSNTIQGSCSIAESSMNPFPGPCVNLLLILNDADDNEVVKARTNAQGQFDFATEQGKAYKIVSGSKFYDVNAPLGLVRGGDKVNLQLRQK